MQENTHGVDKLHLSTLYGQFSRIDEMKEVRDKLQTIINETPSFDGIENVKDNADKLLIIMDNLLIDTATRELNRFNILDFINFSNIESITEIVKETNDVNIHIQVIKIANVLCDIISKHKN